MRYALYTGCAAKGACPELYQSTMHILGHVGIDVVELVEASCCGAGVVSEADPDLGLALAARIFAQAKSKRLEMMTICGTCQGVLGAANHKLKSDPDLRARINGLLADDGLRYDGDLEVKHLLWILVAEVGVERLRTFVQKPLDALRIAPFYGCYILRPSRSLGFDDPEHPVSLDRLIEALGGHAVDYEGKTKCCGFPLVLEKENIAVKMVAKNVKDASDHLADCMVTPCPLCHMNLDIYQRRAEAAANGPLNLPILHLPQLVGLAFGFSPKQMGLHRHLVPTTPIEDKLLQIGAPPAKS